ncbi:solute carrier family 35 member F5-like protein isoform X1 [Cinnamomum micranthum f. kanehirae]|uniref:Solute carrier family 35 member F5-like protein isoform X1 n=1 Tax=Cinnamomum micranthum f. kanehirae TaxID=337451 RepID=A0A3S4PYV3_9MAGN|nr:solute carrier family 35 member F5-like protein isoform X1 [Cinnamomum micranthum f. kanehirae]
MQSKGWRWALGLGYILAVATIWIAASYIVQSVVDAGVSPFLVTYICNSLFVIYVPVVEISRYWEASVERYLSCHRSQNDLPLQRVEDNEKMVLLEKSGLSETGDAENSSEFVDKKEMSQYEKVIAQEPEVSLNESTTMPVSLDDSSIGTETIAGDKDAFEELDAKGRWTRSRVAKVSLMICPFWFLAQLTFNLSLKYTSVTSNTILSSSSSLFTFLASLVVLGEKFTCLKLVSVLLCMVGTIIVSLGDSKARTSSRASKPILGDILSLLAAALYAIYVTLIRKKFPDEESGEGKVSMAQFLGFVGLFNLFIFLPVALVLNFTRIEPFHMLSLKQLSLIVGKGLLDNVLSDYLWAKAVLLTTPTATTAGLSIQIPLAAIVDTLRGHPPHLLNYLGAASIMVGFVGINIPSEWWGSRVPHQEQDAGSIAMVDSNNDLPISSDAAGFS